MVISQITSGIMEQSENAINNVISLIGMMCFWSGIFNIFENTTAIDKLSRLINKVISKIFDKRYLSDEAVKYMSLNITTNILGVGNASTINGIKAIEELQKLNVDKDKPNNNMTLFVVLNTASIQLIPTSMIALRTMYNSSDPAGILIPVWIVTVMSLIVGYTTIKILNKTVD